MGFGRKEMPDDLSQFRGIMTAGVISGAIWCALGLILWFLL